MSGLQGKVAAKRREQETGQNGAAGSGDGSGGEVARRDSVRALLDSMSNEFAAALPAMIPLEHFMRVALTGLKTTPGLAECSRQSLLVALLKCAQSGLLPCTEQAAIIPFKGTATFVPQYQGYVEVFHRTGTVARVEVDWIYEADRWEYVKGDHPSFRHWPNLETPDRGQPKFAYAFLRYKDGTRSDIMILNRAQAEHVRDTHSKAYAKAERERKYDSPWHTSFNDMWLKGLALDTPLPTPSGWTTIGMIECGDQVLDRHGQPTKVIAVSGIKRLDCYRVTFTSGPPIVCDSEHRWIARVGQQKEKTWKIGDLHAAKQGGQPVVVPVAAALELPATDLPVDPWVLGFWLGDGTSAGASVTCHADEVPEVTAAIASAGYVLGSVTPDSRSQAVRVNIRGLRKYLAALGVLGHKHVPHAYLRASTSQRLALLRGLMDSDGTVWQRTGTAGRVRFDNTSRSLADAAAELARSLGEQVLQVERDSVGFGVTAHVHQVSWTPATMPFTISAKTSRARLRFRASYGHRVKSIERVPTVETKCIAVDSLTSTYLAGPAMIPTHNTCIRRLAKYVPKSPELRALLDADETDNDDQSAPVAHGPSTIPGEVIREDAAATPGTQTQAGQPSAPPATDSELWDGQVEDPRDSSWPPVPQPGEETPDGR